MVTMPYISKLDLEEKKITIRTDKIGFFYFVLRINKAFTSINVVKLTKDLNHKKLLKVDEEDLSKLSYLDLLNLAYTRIPEYNFMWEIFPPPFLNIFINKSLNQF